MTDYNGLPSPSGQPGRTQSTEPPFNEASKASLSVHSRTTRRRPRCSPSSERSPSCRAVRGWRLGPGCGCVRRWSSWCGVRKSRRRSECRIRFPPCRSTGSRFHPERSTTAFVGSEDSGFSELAFFGRNVLYRMVCDGSPAWKRLSWLSRLHFFNPLIRRLGRREFGVDHPLPFLLEHDSRKWLG